MSQGLLSHCASKQRKSHVHVQHQTFVGARSPLVSPEGKIYRECSNMKSIISDIVSPLMGSAT